MEREEIIRRLARTLPDQVLRELFPDRDPARIRAALDPASGTGPGSGPAISPQPERRTAPLTCTLHTDGASRGNPGHAGAGFVVYDQQGGELRSGSRYLGTMTNNEAEYRALILGLEAARELGCARLAVHLDSELIVKQINGQYRVKSPGLKPLFARARDLLHEFDQVSVSHVYRTDNTRADQLANQGIDDHFKG